MAMQLATVEQIKGYLAIGSVADDALLARMLDAASGFIQTWINRSLELQSYSALLDGNGSDTLVLRNFPIVSVTELRISRRPVSRWSRCVTEKKIGWAWSARGLPGRPPPTA